MLCSLAIQCLLPAHARFGLLITVLDFVGLKVVREEFFKFFKSSKNLLF